MKNSRTNWILVMLCCAWTSLKSPGALAVEKFWPSNLPMCHVIFNPWLLTSYVDREGLSDWGTDLSTELDSYLLVSPQPKWEEPRSCELEHRGSGYLHTDPTQNFGSDYLASIAIPFHLSLETSFLDLEKEYLLDSSFLTISIWSLDQEKMELAMQHQWKITFGQICEQDQNCRVALNDPTLPVRIHFDAPFLSPSFLFHQNEEIRVRVAWNSQAVCNEAHVDFQMGDQLRILDAISEI